MMLVSHCLSWRCKDFLMYSYVDSRVYFSYHTSARKSIDVYIYKMSFISLSFFKKMKLTLKESFFH